MGIKKLFTVPEGEKVTEKALRRVLISSVCSILLCMTCLVSTTWAWFTVSIENSGNEIVIATAKPNVTILSDQGAVQPTDGSYALDAGSYSVIVELENDAAGDAFGTGKRPVYVIASILHDGEVARYSIEFAGSTAAVTKELSIGNGGASISFSASWAQPEADNWGEALTVGETEPTLESTTPET